jgi:hypothetical protein
MEPKSPLLRLICKVHGLIHHGRKRRIEWSALLLFVLGLCSMAAPHRMVHATVHHQQMPASGSGGTRTARTTRQIGRSARGGMTTEMDVHGSGTSLVSQANNPRVQRLVLATAVAAVPQRLSFAPAPARLLANRDNAAVAALSYESLPSRGRAPPAL